eukprot:364710-Chlamydomonas_euryale.AAC.1
MGGARTHARMPGHMRTFGTEHVRACAPVHAHAAPNPSPRPPWHGIPNRGPSHPRDATLPPPPSARFPAFRKKAPMCSQVAVRVVRIDAHALGNSAAAAVASAEAVTASVLHAARDCQFAARYLGFAVQGDAFCVVMASYPASLMDFVGRLPGGAAARWGGCQAGRLPGGAAARRGGCQAGQSTG